MLVGGQLQMLSPSDTCIGNGKDSLACFLQAAQPVAGTTLANVSGLTLPLQAGASYFFEWFVLIGQATSASTNGLAVNFSGSLSAFAASAYMLNALTPAGIMRVQTVNGTVMLQSATQAAGVTVPIHVVGCVQTLTAGNLTIQAQRSAATCTIAVGSGGHAQQA